MSEEDDSIIDLTTASSDEEEAQRHSAKTRSAPGHEHWLHSAHAETSTPTAALAGLRLHLCAAKAGPPGLDSTEAQAPLRQQPLALPRPDGVQANKLP